jgi:hypothetical protein
LRLDELAFDFRTKETRARWIDVLEQIESGEMPPGKRPRPAPADIAAAAAVLMNGLTVAEQERRVKEGRVVPHLCPPFLRFFLCSGKLQPYSRPKSDTSERTPPKTFNCWWFGNLGECCKYFVLEMPTNGTPAKSLESWIWDAACSIRGAKDAPKYKDYILPLIFTKRLCDVFDDELNRIAKEVGSRAKAFKLVMHDKKLVRFYLPLVPADPEQPVWSVIRKLSTPCAARQRQPGLREGRPQELHPGRGHPAASRKSSSGGRKRQNSAGSSITRS